MAALFSGPDRTPQRPLPPPPTPAPAVGGGVNETQARMDAAAAEARTKAQGRASTVLTGGQGLLEDQNTPSSRKVLLGS